MEWPAHLPLEGGGGVPYAIAVKWVFTSPHIIIAYGQKQISLCGGGVGPINNGS